MNDMPYFYFDSTLYIYMGHPEKHFYNFVSHPIKLESCSNILEKNRFIYALFELLSSRNERRNFLNLKKGLEQALESYFNKYDYTGLTYWNNLDYINLNSFDIRPCGFKIEADGNLILICPEIDLIVPKPYKNLIGKTIEGNFCEVNIDNINDFTLMQYSNKLADEFIYMSGDQINGNNTMQNDFLSSVISIFQNHGLEINNCQDLFLLYQKSLIIY